MLSFKMEVVKMSKEAVVFDKPINDTAVHPGTEGCPKEGDELYSAQGSAY